MKLPNNHENKLSRYRLGMFFLPTSYIHLYGNMEDGVWHCVSHIDLYWTSTAITFHVSLQQTQRSRPNNTIEGCATSSILKTTDCSLLDKYLQLIFSIERGPQKITAILLCLVSLLGISFMILADLNIFKPIHQATSKTSQAISFEFI